MQLSREQIIAFQKTVSLFCPDEQTKKTALKYYFEFKKNCPITQVMKLEYYFKSAFFFAQKSLYLYNMKGERIKGISLSVNQIIKSCPNMQQMLQTIKQFKKGIKLPDYDIQQEVNIFIRIWQLGCAFAIKFEKTFKKFNLQEKVNEFFGYRRTYLSFSWLLFIDAKNKIDIDSYDYTETSCLLVSVCYFMLRYSLDYIRPNFLIDCIEKEGQKRSIITQLIEKLLDMFSIEDIEGYKHIASKFDKYIENLLKNEVIKCSHNKTDFLSPQLININYKRLDTSYQKKLDPSSIDHRLFISNRVMTLSPSKTPVSKHKALKKKKPIIIQENNKKYASHRVLNYDNFENVSPKEISPPQNRNLQLKLPLKMTSPSTVKTPLLCASPISINLQTYNFINNRAKQVTSVSPKRPMYKKAIGLIQSINSNYNKVANVKNPKNRNMLTLCFYINIAEQFFTYEQQTQSFHFSLLTFAIYIVRSLNLTTGTFNDISNCLQSDILDLWIVSHYLINFDKKIPQKLKSELMRTQDEIICSQIFKHETLLAQIVQLTNNNIDNEYLALLLQYLLEYCNNEIDGITNYLNLNYQIRQQSLNCIKYFLTTNQKPLINRHIDQIIMCSIYVACRANNLEIKFNSIKTAYQKVNYKFKHLHQEIIFNVYHSEHNFINVIEFYNQIFIKQINPFVSYMQKSQFEEFHMLIQKTAHQYDQNQNHENEKIVTHSTVYSIEQQDSQILHPINHNNNVLKQEEKHINLVTHEHGYRNQTTVRTRPTILNIQFLCDTEKGRYNNDIR